jgi:hypothetical protein
MFGTIQGQRGSAELSHTLTYIYFLIPTYSSLVSATKWRLIIPKRAHQKTPDNEPHGPRQPLTYSCRATVRSPINEQI